MISIFTPSHDPRFLSEAYETLKAQTFSEWEWVVLLNGGARWESPEDPRVRCASNQKLRGVGEAKRLACAISEGEILVELDHDDLLAPTALERIRDALANSDVAYSDCAQVEEDGGYCADLFDLRNGWKYRDEEVLGRTVLRCESFEPLPHNLGYIWFAPNHVRAFTREVYERAGGYDASREILDDQDLLARLYKTGTFTRIPECLYLQRMHEGNTQRHQATNDQIQQDTVYLYDETINDLCLSWAKRNSLATLDLGAAHNPTPGYLSVDMAGDVDLKGDIFEVLGELPDNSVGVVRAADFLEHIADKIRIWNELYRVLAHGGMILSLTPSTDGRGAWQDPTHVAGYNENASWYFTDPAFQRFVPELKCRFQESRLVTYFPSDWHREHQIPYLCFNAIAIKDGPRLGGICHWENS